MTLDTTATIDHAADLVTTSDPRAVWHRRSRSAGTAGGRIIGSIICGDTRVNLTADDGRITVDVLRDGYGLDWSVKLDDAPSTVLVSAIEAALEDAMPLEDAS